jgi:hypothetical protein
MPTLFAPPRDVLPSRIGILFKTPCACRRLFFFHSHSTNRISVNTAFLVLIFTPFEPPCYYLFNGTDINPMPTLFAPPRVALHFFIPCACRRLVFFPSHSTNRISVNTAFLVLVFAPFEPPCYYLSNGIYINPMPTLFAPPRDALHFFYPLCLSSTCFLSFSLYRPYLCRYCIFGVDFCTIRTALLLSI